jgi:hypothetical protein
MGRLDAKVAVVTISPGYVGPTSPSFISGESVIVDGAQLAEQR